MTLTDNDLCVVLQNNVKSHASSQRSQPTIIYSLDILTQGVKISNEPLHRLTGVIIFDLISELVPAGPIFHRAI